MRRSKAYPKGPVLSCPAVPNPPAGLRGLAEQLGGNLRMEPALQGTRVALTFPL